MDIWCKNSAFRVMTNTRKGRTDSAFLYLHGARGGRVSGQILLRGLADFTIQAVTVDAAAGLPESAVTLYRQGLQYFNDGVPYPDKLLPIDTIAVKAHVTQGFWVVLDVPAETAAGRYDLTVKIQTETETLSANVSLRVYDVQMPAPADGALDHEYWYQMSATELCGGPWKAGSDEWWHFAESLADTLKMLRVNTLCVSVYSVMEGRSRRTGKDSWQFDFTLFDEFVTRMFDRGSFRRIAISAPLASLTGDRVQAFDEAGKVIWLDTRSSEGEAYLTCWLQALHAHLTEKGWLDKTILHIEDEPHESDNWLWMRALVRRYMPSTPCGEPIDEYDSALALKDDCDEFIPRLEVFEQGRDFFARRQADGSKVWCYSCCYPEEPWYLNRFIDQPAMYARMLYWACFAQDITGFLHWGFNYWGGSLYGLQPEARFKGDGYVVYPAAGGVMPSSRLLLAAEGAEEYELFCMTAKHDKEAAKALALGITRSFSDFNDDPSALEAARVRLLELCEAHVR